MECEVVGSNPPPNPTPNPNPNPNLNPNRSPNSNPNPNSGGERNAWKFLTGFKRTLQKLGWHDSQDMPNLKPSMGDSTLHSVSVVAVVSERQG